MNIQLKTLSKILKDARLSKKLSLRQVETSVGVSNAYLSQLENGRIANPSAAVLYRLSLFFEIPFEELIAGIEDSNKYKLSKANEPKREFPNVIFDLQRILKNIEDNSSQLSEVDLDEFTELSEEYQAAIELLKGDLGN